MTSEFFMDVKVTFKQEYWNITPCVTLYQEIMYIKSMYYIWRILTFTPHESPGWGCLMELPDGK